MRKPLSGVHAKTLHKINARAEWISSPEMGWDVTGLCTSAKWEMWGEVLRLLYKEFSTSTIGDLFGVSVRIIVRDMEEFGIELRPRGGANHHGATFDRVWHKGKGYPSVSAVAMAHGKTPGQIHSRMSNYGLSLRQAIEAAL